MIFFSKRNKTSILFLSIISASFLTACSTQPTTKQNNHSVASKTTGYNTPTDTYIAKRATALTGVALASTNNTCVDHFNFLKESQSNKYTEFSKNYGDIAKGYRFLNVNKNIMDNDAKQVYSMMLEMKLETLCSKVQYTGYSVVKSKIKELSSI